ncbi:MAG: alpha/beta hydrolase [Myxococcota bacterium]
MSRDRKQASLRHRIAEARAPLEFASMLAAFPWLARGRRGDGHSVVVLPGYLASDGSTVPLRSFLSVRGFRPLGWGAGRNPGFTSAIFGAVRELVRARAADTNKPVSLVGWSLGGVYAREIARRSPESVRCVVTLGSPIQVDERTREAPPVPSTAIFSATDGVVAPYWAQERNGQRSENIEVPASHFGLGYNPLVLHAIADRLRQDPDAWAPFRATGPAARLYRADRPITR